MEQRRKDLKKTRMDNKAQVGIGTMIVFIATVLVAAIAAGVLIDMSGKLQERSSRTGSEATEQVSSNLAIDSIVGRRDATSDAGLKDLDMYLSLAPGASEVDLGQLKLQMSNGTVLAILSHADTATPAANQFNVTAIRDADSSFTSAAPVMTAGDLVKLTIDLTAQSAEFEPRDNVRLLLEPEVGASVQTGFGTPNSYGVKTIVVLD